MLETESSSKKRELILHKNAPKVRGVFLNPLADPYRPPAASPILFEVQNKMGEARVGAYKEKKL